MGRSFKKAKKVELCCARCAGKVFQNHPV